MALTLRFFGRKLKNNEELKAIGIEDLQLIFNQKAGLLARQAKSVKRLTEDLS